MLYLKSCKNNTCLLYTVIVICLGKAIHTVFSKVYSMPQFKILHWPPAALKLRTLLHWLSSSETKNTAALAFKPCKCWVRMSLSYLSSSFSWHTNHTGLSPGLICQTLFHLKHCTWSIICLKCSSLSLSHSWLFLTFQELPQRSPP